jgi:hypothetical protein
MIALTVPSSTSKRSACRGEVLGRHPARAAVRRLHLEQLAIRLGRRPNQVEPKAVPPLDHLACVRHGQRVNGRGQLTRSATEPEATLTCVLRLVRSEPSAVLLAAQLTAVLLYPFMEGSAVGRALFSVFGIGILVLVVLAVRSSPGLTWVGIVLGVPATVLLLIQAVTGDDRLLPYSSTLEAVLYFYAAGALIAYMLADHDITRDELFAVGATFTLLAWAFAYS